MSKHAPVRVLLLISGLALSLCAQGAPEADDIPRDVLKGIEAMRRLPAEGFHIVQSQGRLLIVSTNGHYVVSGGRIIDLWNNLEIRSVGDVDKSLRIPLARMGIEVKSLGGIAWGNAQAHQVLTVFLDGESQESRKLLPELRKLSGRYRIDAVFVPAKSARAAVNRALICDRGAAAAFLAEGRVPPGVSDRDACGVKELDRARVIVQLLGITQLPFSIAPNGVTTVGTPQKYAEWAAANEVSQ